jgi:hypothetical protein
MSPLSPIAENSMRVGQLVGFACLFFASATVRAQEAVSSERSAFDFTHCWGGCTTSTHTQKRAGCPQEVAAYARPSESPAFCGYYVGGGNVFRGQERTAAGGTWAWDYQGRLLLRRVALSWSDGRRYQGGSGAYRADGGPHIPDLPGAAHSALHLQTNEHK